MKKIGVFLLGIICLFPLATRTEPTDHRGVPLTMAALVAAGIGYGAWKLCSRYLDKLESKDITAQQRLWYHTLVALTSGITASCCLASPLLLVGAIEGLNDEFGQYDVEEDIPVFTLANKKKICIEPTQSDHHQQKIITHLLG